MTDSERSPERGQRAGDAFGVEHRGQDQADPAEQRGVRGIDAEHVLHGRHRDPAGHQKSADDGAGDGRDAAQVGEGQEGDGCEGAEGGCGDGAEPVGREGTAHPGHEGGQPERQQLGAGHIDSAGGSRPFVRSHREQPPPGR